MRVIPHLRWNTMGLDLGNESLFQALADGIYYLVQYRVCKKNSRTLNFRAVSAFDCSFNYYRSFRSHSLTFPEAARKFKVYTFCLRTLKQWHACHSKLIPVHSSSCQCHIVCFWGLSYCKMRPGLGGRHARDRGLIYLLIHRLLSCNKMQAFTNCSNFMLHSKAGKDDEMMQTFRFIEFWMIKCIFDRGYVSLERPFQKTLLKYW